MLKNKAKRQLAMRYGYNALIKEADFVRSFDQWARIHLIGYSYEELVEMAEYARSKGIIYKDSLWHDTHRNVFRYGNWVDVDGNVFHEDEKFKNITDDELVEACFRRGIADRVSRMIEDL